jgi:hypothetical protein
MAKRKKEYKLSEMESLRLENTILKMGDVQQRASVLNAKFGELAQVRNQIIEDERTNVGAPPDFMVAADFKSFVPPPPNPPVITGQGGEVDEETTPED